MKKTPIDPELVNRIIAENGIKEVGRASIREIKRLINDIESASGVKFVRMEMGIPGIPACKVGVDAQIKALQNGIATIYPDLDGTPELKKEASRFIKNFIDLDISPESCFPTVGSMMAGLVSFMTLARREKQKDTTLFIDPGFPVQKNQHKVLGLKYETFDVYDFPNLKATSPKVTSTPSSTPIRTTRHGFASQTKNCVSSANWPPNMMFA